MKKQSDNNSFLIIKLSNKLISTSNRMVSSAISEKFDEW